MRARHVHLTPLGGMAGDMFAAALLDAMPELAAPVLDAVRAALPTGTGAELVPGTSRGLAALRFTLRPPAELAPAAYPALARRIADAPLVPEVRDLAGVLLRRLAEAEAAVHRVPLEAVHFHEIADWDTLADLTAAAEILVRLGDAGWSLDPFPVGGGSVSTAHGPLPVPAPAAARLMQGLPVIDDGIPGERVTPTGAVIAAAIAARAGPRPAGRLGPTGYGAGTREIDGIANVLVAQVLLPDATLGVGQDRIGVIEFDIDDMTGEEIATAAAHLRSTSGVTDVVTATASGKKGRAATLFRVLFRPACEDAVAAACFAQTSTLGLRLRSETRLVLPRTAIGLAPTRVKEAQRPNGEVTRKAEADDIAPGDSLATRRSRTREAET